jgi:hypothetical protein
MENKEYFEFLFDELFFDEWSMLLLLLGSV